MPGSGKLLFTREALDACLQRRSKSHRRKSGISGVFDGQPLSGLSPDT
jgi:hypothetical protein